MIANVSAIAIEINLSRMADFTHKRKYFVQMAIMIPAMTCQLKHGEHKNFHLSVWFMYNQWLQRVHTLSVEVYERSHIKLCLPNHVWQMKPYTQDKHTMICKDHDCKHTWLWLKKRNWMCNLCVLV